MNDISIRCSISFLNDCCISFVLRNSMNRWYFVPFNSSVCIQALFNFRQSMIALITLTFTNNVFTKLITGAVYILSFSAPTCLLVPDLDSFSLFNWSVCFYRWWLFFDKTQSSIRNIVVQLLFFVIFSFFFLFLVMAMSYFSGPLNL